MDINKIIINIADFFMPRYCSVCGRQLAAHEKHLCASCLMDLPETDLHAWEFNSLEQVLAGRAKVEHAYSCFYYEKDSPYSAILHDIKYRNLPKMGRWLAKRHGKKLIRLGLLTDVDYVLPVPLHSLKRIKRGYNQSEFIAQGYANALDAEVLTNVLFCKKGHGTQTHQNRTQRWENTEGVYAARNTAGLEGKHVLIVDDVATTGATIIRCANVLESIPGLRISVATLAKAKQD